MTLIVNIWLTNGEEYSHFDMFVKVIKGDLHFENTWLLVL